MAENVPETRPPEPPPKPPEVPRPTERDRRTEGPTHGWPNETQQSAQQDARGAAQSEYAKAVAPEGNRTVELDDRVTRPTGELGGRPDGEPTRIGPKEDDEVRRSLTAENNCAVVLADKGGYRVKQNPSADEVAQSRQESGDKGRPTAEPDYLVEGRVFDCYAPTENTNARNIYSAVERKVEDGQTQRVVLNLEGWQGNMSDLQRQFDTWPIEDLKEVKAITPDGDIVQIIPNLGND